MIAQATRAVMPFHHTGVYVFVAQQGHHVHETRFATNNPDIDPLDATPFVNFFDSELAGFEG